MDSYMINGYPGSTNGSGTARGNKGDINYDIRKTLNAKLEGNQGKTFFKTNPRPAKTPDFKNHSRVMELPNDYILHPYRFDNSVNLDAIPEFKIGYHHNAPVLSHDKIKVSTQQLVQDYIHGRNNMYNDLEPVRCALKPNEPLIPASSYLRGLLSEPKSTVSAGIVPLTSTSGPGSGPTGSGPGPALGGSGATSRGDSEPPALRGRQLSGPALGGVGAVSRGGSEPPVLRGRQLSGPTTRAQAQAQQTKEATGPISGPITRAQAQKTKETTVPIPRPAPGPVPAPGQPEKENLSFGKFKEFISKKDKTPSEIESLIHYAQTNQGSTNKYLNKNKYKGANTIEELVVKLRENTPSKTKTPTKASSSITPTIGTPVIQSKKKTLI